MWRFDRESQSVLQVVQWWDTTTFFEGAGGGGKILGQTVLLQVNGSFVVVCTETVNDSELFHHSVLVLSRGNGSYRIPVG